MAAAAIQIMPFPRGGGASGGRHLHEQLAAFLGHAAARLLLAWHGGPALLLDVVRLLPRAADLSEFLELPGLLGILVEANDTEGSQTLGHRLFPARQGHLLRGAPGDPSAPGEADDHR